MHVKVSEHGTAEYLAFQACCGNGYSYLSHMYSNTMTRTCQSRFEADMKVDWTYVPK
jgi:hypothetical protein